MTNKFMRLPGFREEIFEKMLKVLEEKEGSKASKAVRKRKLSLRDQLLMTLEYLREYRTYFHIGNSYGIQTLHYLERRPYSRAIWNMRLL